MKVKVGETYLTGIPHEKGNLRFRYPSFKGNYGSIAKQIDEAGLKRAISAQTASLVYDVLQNPKGKHEAEILDILKNSWLIEFNGNLYLPKKEGEEVHNGVIIESNPTIENGKLVMNRKSLIERLNKNDSNVKFVPFGYDIKEQSTHRFIKNPYIVARYGEEGADKIAELASKYEENPCLWSFKSVDNEIARMSALSDGSIFGNGLVINGDGLVADNGGHSFGVSITN